MMLPPQSQAQPQFLLFLLACCLALCICSSGSSGSISSTPREYSSIQALDTFGNSIQLAHARQASQQHGTLVLVAICCGNTNGNGSGDTRIRIPNTIMSVSLHTTTSNTNSNINANMNMNMNMNTKQPQPQMMQLLSKQNNVAMICTGIKADARWLLQTMREYQMKSWERYNDNNKHSHDRIVLAMSQVLLEFMGYARTNEFMDGIGPVIAGNSPTWARPLGVQTIVASLAKPTLILLEPSGIQKEYRAYALGKGSELCLEELVKVSQQQKLQQQQGDEKEWTRDTCQEMLIDIIQRKVIAENPSMYQKAEFWVESFTEHGVERVIVPVHEKDHAGRQ